MARIPEAAREGATRALALGLLFVATFQATAAGHGAWPSVFALLLAGVGVPVAAVEGWGLAAGRPGRIAVPFACGAIAAVWFVAAFVQTTQLQELLASGAYAGVLGRIEADLVAVGAIPSETAALLTSFAAPFALAAGCRVAGLALGRSLAVTVLGGAAAQALALREFDGWPVVAWVATVRWSDPGLGTWVLSFAWWGGPAAVGCGAFARWLNGAGAAAGADLAAGPNGQRP